MVEVVVRHFLAFLIASSLIGAGSLPAAAFAQASRSQAAMQSGGGNGTNATEDESAQSNPCDSMPCKSMPCNGAMPDCAQMCLSLNAPLALETPVWLAAMPGFTNATADWPLDIAPPGRSIKPDPFPPKRLIPA